MASFEIYCPCKVKEIGVARVTGDLAYFLWVWIANKDSRAKCKFCGQIVRIIEGNLPNKAMQPIAKGGG